MNLTEELFALSESEALDLFYELKFHHNWAATVFDEADIEDLWNEYRADNPQWPRWPEVREQVLKSRFWGRALPEALAARGNDLINEFMCNVSDAGEIDDRW
jgi:hypothetical protein